MNTRVADVRSEPEPLGAKAAIDPEKLFHQLFDAYGPQHWWPAKTALEVMLGAILTQNTNWSNVEKALTHLRQQRLLSESGLKAVSLEHLAQLIRPAGFYRRKSACIKSLIDWLQFHGGIAALAQQSGAQLRTGLLNIPGIGAETADAILLYALGKPVFVVDKYTRRIVSRIGLLDYDMSYAQHQKFLTARLLSDLSLFQEFHALFVIHAKTHCRSIPKCEICPLRADCSYRLLSLDLK